MKLKKIFALMLSILFVAALSAQTKKVATNKREIVNCCGLKFESA